MKYMKSVLWRVAKRLSYIEEARCLKVKSRFTHSMPFPCHAVPLIHNAMPRPCHAQKVPCPS